MAGTETKKIAINAILLYLRTGVSMILQLIAVRYLLKYLGVDGFGLYGLIGSIVTIVSSVKGLLASSVQRFLNIAIGENKINDIYDIFNSAIIIQGILGIILSVSTMIIGYIMVPYLQIPANYIKEVWWVLLFSALTIGIDVLTVPYSAMLVAYEKFSVYAILSIIESLLKLFIVLILFIYPEFRVAIYSGMLFVTALIIRTIYIVISKKYFRDLVKLRKVIDKRFLKRMSVFTGYKGIGTISNALQNSGINFILNVFGGLIVNTARSISYQVLTSVNVLVWNINFAFMPRITTLYGEKKLNEYGLMIERMAKLTFIINVIMTFSISLLIYPILKLWLGEVPLYAPGFIIIILTYAISKSFIDSIDAVFSSENKVRIFQIILCIGMISTLVTTWFMLKLGYSYYWGFGAMSIIELITCIACYVLAKYTTEFNVNTFVKRVALPACYTVAILLLCGLIIFRFIPSEISILPLISLSIILILIAGIISLRIMLSKSEIKNIINTIKIYYNTKIR